MIKRKNYNIDNLCGVTTTTESNDNYATTTMASTPNNITKEQVRIFFQQQKAIFKFAICSKLYAGNGNDQNFQGGVFSKNFRPGGYFSGSFQF